MHHTKPVSKLHPHDIPTEQWEIVGTDMIGELPKAGGFDATSVFTNKFTKRLRLVLMHTTVTSEGMARIFQDWIFSLHGLPQKFVHDCGPQYHSKFMKELYQLLGIKGNFTTAYHLQTNGQTEQMNQEIEHYLQLFINYHQTDWHEWLPMAEFVYNDREHSLTKVTPFFANNGHHPSNGTNPKMTSNNPTAQEFAEQMQKTQDKAALALKKAADDMKQQYDIHCWKSVEYKEGDQVWLEGTNISGDHPMKKLSNKYYGPFKLITKIGKSVYKLALPKIWKVSILSSMKYF